MKVKHWLLLALAGLTAGCVDSGRGDGENAPSGPINPVFTLQAALEEAVDTSIIPAAETFRSSVLNLNDAAEDFCGSASEASLDTLQERWRESTERWYRLALYNFGPLNDDIVFPAFTFIDSLRLRGTDYLETVRSDIARDLSGSRELSVDYFAGKNFQLVGLLALESVIFETSTPEHSQAATDILAEYAFAPRKCDLLQGLSGALLMRAQYVEDGWKLAHRDSQLPYRTLFLDGELDDGSEPITQLLVAGQEMLDYLQARRVVTTAAQVSGYSWEAVAATIDEVELLLRGSLGGRASFFDVMIDTGNQNAVDTIQNNIIQVRQAIADRDAAMLEITLGFLDGNFKREIPDSLDVELGINFTDGD